MVSSRSLWSRVPQFEKRESKTAARRASQGVPFCFWKECFSLGLVYLPWKTKNWEVLSQCQSSHSHLCLASCNGRACMCLWCLREAPNRNWDCPQKQCLCLQPTLVAHYWSLRRPCLSLCLCPCRPFLCPSHPFLCPCLWAALCRRTSSGASSDRPRWAPWDVRCISWRPPASLASHSSRQAQTGHWTLHLLGFDFLGQKPQNKPSKA